MSYQQSTNESGDLDLLCMRHARSGFNQAEIDFFNKHPDLKYPEAELNEEFRREVLFSEKFIDTHLSEAGVQQCHDVKHDPTLSRVKAVLVSPFNRALQTAKIVFGDKGVPIIVHPLLAESFRYSCDLSSPIKSKMA
jgi:broad specificity phosphatase PhoE